MDVRPSPEPLRGGRGLRKRVSGTIVRRGGAALVSLRHGDCSVFPLFGDNLEKLRQFFVHGTHYLCHIYPFFQNSVFSKKETNMTSSTIYDLLVLDKTFISFGGILFMFFKIFRISQNLKCNAGQGNNIQK